VLESPLPFSSVQYPSVNAFPIESPPSTSGSPTIPGFVAMNSAVRVPAARLVKLTITVRVIPPAPTGNSISVPVEPASIHLRNLPSILPDV